MSRENDCDMDNTEMGSPEKTADEVLAMDGIVVQFGDVRVLDPARLRVEKGEIHALLGENGAGKSSLMKVLFGLYEKEEGQITLRGEEVDIESPQDALGRGVAMIHQELPFALHLSTAENIFLGRERRSSPLGLVDRKRQHREAAEILEPFPVEIAPSRPMRELSVAEQQIVAIAKALSTGADLIILDEATTALTDHEAERLFELMEDLKAEGKTFVMITHKLDEVFAVADRMTILRDGETVASSLPVGEVGQREVVRHMVGRDVEEVFPERRVEQGEELLRVEGLSTRKLREVSFTLRRGEVLGIGGLMGAGRTSLFDALFGAIPRTEGTLHVRGEPVRIRSPRDAIASGIAYVTEDRKKNGLALDLGVKDNVALIKTRDHTRLGFIDDEALERLSAHYTEKLAIDARTARTADQLSGGNQQKVVLAKWLATEADIFLMDEPTRGIDVGTKMDVYALINELTEAGKGVLLVTSELPELMAMSDRFVVLSEGHLVRELSEEEATPEKIIYHASKKPEAAAQQQAASQKNTA